MFAKTFKTATLALTLAAPLAATEAHANGQITIDYRAQNDEEAQAIGAVLGLYRIANGADVAQVLGSCSNAVIHQEGNGHSGSLVQNGDCQSYGLVQLGNGTEQHVVQTPDGDAGIGIVFGFD